MLKLKSSFAAAGLVTATLAVPAHADPPGGTSGWTQTINDVFANDSSLNIVNDTTTNGTWISEFGEQNGSTNGLYRATGDGTIIDPSYVTLSKDLGTQTLRMEVNRVSGSYQSAQGNTYTSNYTGSVLSSCFKTFQTYGYFEASVRIPNKNGVSLSWWIPCLEAWPPEIDIVECPGGVGRNSSGQMTNVYQTTHYINPYNQYSNGVQQNVWASSVGDLSAGFHTYGLLWQPGLLAWYVDGVCRYVNTYGVPDRRMFVQLELAAKDNDPGWNGDATNTSMPQYAYVQWVKTWKRTAGDVGTVALYSENTSDYVTAGSATTSLLANYSGTATPGAAQLFDVHQMNQNGQVALIAHSDSDYVTTNGVTTSLLAARTSPSSWETFQIGDISFDNVSLQSLMNNEYLSCTGTTTAIGANGTSVSTAATSPQGFKLKNQLQLTVKP